MKKLYFIKVLLFLIFINLFSIIYCQEYFYYSYGEKIPLVLSEHEITLKFKTETTLQQRQNVLSKESLIRESVPIKLAACKEFLTCKLESPTNVTQLVSHLKQNKEIDIVNPVCFINGKTKVRLYDRFVVQFNTFTSKQEIDALNDKYHVKIIKISSASPNRYVLKITAETNMSVLDIANIYHIDPRVEYSLPDFIVDVNLCSVPNDTYFSNQYYLRNTGQTGGINGVDINVDPAWDLTSGSSSITVAVIDAGGSAHEDIPASRIAGGYDYIDEDNDPSAGGNEAHGMACAGIIAATKDNNIGISGIAPKSKLMFFRVFNSFKEGAVSHFVEAIDSAWMSGVDIINNSWGFSGPPNNDINAAIGRAMTQGRNGKGTSVVFAVGNNADRNNNYYGFIENPASHPGVIAVGAIDKSNNIQNYSPRGTGAQLTVVAPSGATSTDLAEKTYKLNGDVWSTDISGQPGWNSGVYGIGSPTEYIKYIWDSPGGDASSVGNYTARFGGTSAACPQVSGAVALILSLNPNLTKSQVKFIIERTATNMGSSYSIDYGYGRLNVYDALEYTLERHGGTLRDDVKLNNSLSIEFGAELTIASNAILDLNSFSIFKADDYATITIENGATIDPYICLKNGSVVKGLYPNLEDALTVASSGETIEIGSDITLSSDITVGNGITLKVNENGELKFASGKYLYVNSGGNLTANGATFTSTSSTWSGIKYNSGSTGSLTNCSISNASNGVYLNGSNRTITNCTITNCTNGIYCKNCVMPYLESNTISGGIKGINNYYSSPKIVENTISSTTGIYNYYSSPNIGDNEITSTGIAIYCENNSSPNVATLEGASASNYCHASSVIYGIFATNSSHPVFGATECGGNYGDNSFVYNSCDALAYAKDGCSIYAPHNWWGSSSPSQYLFEEDGGTIIYLPCLGSIPTYSMQQPSPENNLFDTRVMLSSSVPETQEASEDLTKYYNDQWSLKKKIEFIRYLYAESEAVGVADLCKDIIFENPYAPEAFTALDMIYQISKNEKIKKDIDKNMFKTYLKTFEGDKSNKLLVASAILILAGLEKNISRMDKVYNEHKNDYMGKYALHQQFMYYFHEVEDMELAKKILYEMDEVYPDEAVTYESHVLMGDDVVDYREFYGKNTPETVQLTMTDISEIIPEEYSLNATYPNPFNPTTTLEYALPVQSKVNCSIFDVAGNLINEFVYDQNPGIHKIIWNGSNVSSGIYLIRFTAEAQDGSNSFVDYQKVTLLK